MNYRSRNYLKLVLMILLLSTGMVHSEQKHDGGMAGSHADRSILTPGERMVLDAVALRPLGMVATAAGSLVYVISLPFSIPGGNEAQVREQLVKQPARYTFTRPLGEFD